MLAFQNPGSGEAFYLDASEHMTKGDPDGVVELRPDSRGGDQDGGHRDLWAKPPFPQR